MKEWSVSTPKQSRQSKKSVVFHRLTVLSEAMVFYVQKKGELKPGEAMPSMRKLAKNLHVSVITTQRAYDDLQKDGFIVTVAAKGTFVSTQNQDFIREENLRRIEKLLSDAAALGRENGLSLEELKKTLEVIYTED